MLPSIPTTFLARHTCTQTTHHLNNIPCTPYMHANHLHTHTHSPSHLRVIGWVGATYEMQLGTSRPAIAPGHLLSALLPAMAQHPPSADCEFRKSCLLMLPPTSVLAIMYNLSLPLVNTFLCSRRCFISGDGNATSYNAYNLSLVQKLFWTVGRDFRLMIWTVRLPHEVLLQSKDTSLSVEVPFLLPWLAQGASCYQLQNWLVSGCHKYMK